MNILEYPQGIVPILSRKVYHLIKKSDILIKFDETFVHKIPEQTMPFAVAINFANMIFGFSQYKKKWWYYLILLISIIISICLIDCYYILIHQDDSI